MRKVTQEIVHAFYYENKERKIGNSAIRIIHDAFNQVALFQLTLHGNVIAERKAGHLETRITNAGWFSTTTKERLNGIPGVSIQQKKGVWYLNGNEWNGSWATIFR